MKGDLRRNSSSDVTNATQVCIPAIKVTLQEAPIIRMCLMNIREKSKPKISKGKLLPPH